MRFLLGGGYGPPRETQGLGLPELFPGPLSEAALADMLLRENGGPKALITHCPTGAPAIRIFRIKTLWATWPLLGITDMVRGLWYLFWCVAFGS